MNDDLLKKRLAELEVPEPDETARERALHRALVALANSAKTNKVPAEKRRPALWRWVLAAGALGAFVLAVWPGGQPAKENSLAWQRTLEQVEALFPGQVNAVIERDGKFAVELTDHAAGGTGQPVVVEFVQGPHVLRVLSYSGRRVCVELGGAKACFEPLITADGGVILAGEDFLWSSEHPAPQAGYRVQARFLHPAS